MRILVDSTKYISPENGSKIKAFFESETQRNRNNWKAGKLYSSKDGTEFVFAQKVIKHQSGSKPGEMRYDYFGSDAAGRGAMGKVYLINSRMAIQSDGISFKQAGYKSKTGEEKFHLVKMQSYKTQSDKNCTQNEYQYGEPLRMKAPVIDLDEQVSYLVMGKASGCELTTIINNDRTGVKLLTAKERQELTIALLKALKEQVIDRKIIHLDIKPENIIVNMDTKPITVKIIDYAFGQPFNSSFKFVCGTPGYVAPEIFIGQKPTSRTDIFSLGMTLLLIWGIDPRKNHPVPKNPITAEELLNLYNMSKKIDLTSLFGGIKDLSKETESLIHSLLSGMTAARSEDRPEIDFLIDKFEQNKEETLEVGTIASTIKSSASESIDLTHLTEEVDDIVKELEAEITVSTAEVSKSESIDLSLTHLTEEVDVLAAEEFETATTISTAETSKSESIDLSLSQLAEEVDVLAEELKTDESLSAPTPKHNPRFNEAIFSKLLLNVEMLRVHSSKLLERGEEEISKQLKTVATNLLANFNIIESLERVQNEIPVKERTEKLKEALTNAQQIVNQAKDETSFKEHRNINYILANIAVAISTLVIPYVIAGIANLLKTGNFLFFTQTKTSKLLDKVSESFDHVANPLQCK